MVIVAPHPRRCCRRINPVDLDELGHQRWQYGVLGVDACVDRIPAATAYRRPGMRAAAGRTTGCPGLVRVGTPADQSSERQSAAAGQAPPRANLEAIPKGSPNRTLSVRQSYDRPTSHPPPGEPVSDDGPVRSPGHMCPPGTASTPRCCALVVQDPENDSGSDYYP